MLTTAITDNGLLYRQTCFLRRTQCYRLSQQQLSFDHDSVFGIGLLTFNRPVLLL